MITPELQKIYASAPDDDREVETMTLEHSLFSQTYNVVNQSLPFTGTDELGNIVTYEPFPFTIEIPERDGEGRQDIGLVVSNVSREMVTELESANELTSEPIAVSFRLYMLKSKTLGNPNPVRLHLSEITATMTTIVARAGRPDLVNRPFPATVYEIRRFPGLDR